MPFVAPLYLSWYTFIIHIFLLGADYVNTVLVIGAGAGAEASLPTGHGLKKGISTDLNLRFKYNDLESGDYLIREAISIHCQKDANKRNKFYHAARSAYSGEREQLFRPNLNA